MQLCNEGFVSGQVFIPAGMVLDDDDAAVTANPEKFSAIVLHVEEATAEPGKARRSTRPKRGDG